MSSSRPSVRTLDTWMCQSCGCEIAIRLARTPDPKLAQWPCGERWLSMITATDSHLRAIRSRTGDRSMLKFACPIAATLLTATPSFADARKPFVGICEGVVQLGFFIDGTVSVPAGKTHRDRSIGHYRCTFTDPEISNACPNGATCRVMALMRGGNQFQILSVFGVARVSETPGISPPRRPRFGPSDQPPARPTTPQPM
jgi:hypothetical protein